MRIVERGCGVIEGGDIQLACIIEPDIDVGMRVVPAARAAAAECDGADAANRRKTRGDTGGNIVDGSHDPLHEPARVRGREDLRISPGAP
jgi:hypothetical protein